MLLPQPSAHREPRTGNRPPRSGLGRTRQRLVQSRALRSRGCGDGTSPPRRASEKTAPRAAAAPGSPRNQGRVKGSEQRAFMSQRARDSAGATKETRQEEGSVTKSVQNFTRSLSRTKLEAECFKMAFISETDVAFVVTGFCCTPPCFSGFSHLPVSGFFFCWQ